MSNKLVKRVMVLSQIVLAPLLKFAPVAHSSTKPTDAYKISMENDALFIESVAELFHGLANLQRTIVNDLKWTKGNSEQAKIDQAVKNFSLSKKKLEEALINSDRLLNSLDEDDAKKFAPQLQEFKKKISNLSERLSRISDNLKNNKFPDRVYLHKTIHLALAGVGFGMEVSKGKFDPGDEM